MGCFYTWGQQKQLCYSQCCWAPPLCKLLSDWAIPFHCTDTLGREIFCSNFLRQGLMYLRLVSNLLYDWGLLFLLLLPAKFWNYRCEPPCPILWGDWDWTQLLRNLGKHSTRFPARNTTPLKVTFTSCLCSNDLLQWLPLPPSKVGFMATPDLGCNRQLWAKVPFSDIFVSAHTWHRRVDVPCYVSPPLLRGRLLLY